MLIVLAAALLSGGCASAITKPDGTVIKAGFGNEISTDNLSIKPAQNVVDAGQYLGEKSIEHSDSLAQSIVDSVSKNAAQMPQTKP